MALSLEKIEQPILQHRNATWQDYVTVRDGTDVKGRQIFAFGLTDLGVYEAIQVSQILTDLPIDWVEQMLEGLTAETNTAAANWLMQQL